MHMKKGFIGPIGDDLPSILGIVLALGLFFAGITYSLNVYNQKGDNLTMMKGSIEITRTITKSGIITDLPTASQSAEPIAESYGLQHKANFGSKHIDCSDNAYVFTYLVAKSGPDLATLHICVWEG